MIFFFPKNNTLSRNVEDFMQFKHKRQRNQTKEQTAISTARTRRTWFYDVGIHVET